MSGESEGDRILSQGFPTPTPLQWFSLPVANSDEDRGQNSGDGAEEDWVFGQNPGGTASHHGHIGQETNPPLPSCWQSPTPTIGFCVKPSCLSREWHDKSSGDFARNPGVLVVAVNCAQSVVTIGHDHRMPDA